MNAEQKQRAQEAKQYWRASFDKDDVHNAGQKMAALLQELIDAPEPEPVGYTNETELDYVRKYEALPVSGTFWPTSDEDACVALYTAPPANNQSEQQLEMVNAPAPSVPDGWRPFLTDVITAAGLLEHGKRDKGLAGRIGKFAFDAMRAAPTPAEPPTDLPTWENGDDPLVSGGLIHRGVVDLAMNQLLETLK